MVDVICPECGCTAHRVYPREVTEKELNPITKFKLKTLYQCDDSNDCAWVWNLSRDEIATYFSLGMEEQGVEGFDIIRTAIDKKNEIKREYGEEPITDKIRYKYKRLRMWFRDRIPYEYRLFYSGIKVIIPYVFLALFLVFGLQYITNWLLGGIE